MEKNVSEIYVPNFTLKLPLPLVSSNVCAGFPSPAEDYIEGRIDLNRDLIKNPFATFYIRVTGDSMEPLICAGELLVVDRMAETKDKDVVVIRLASDLCVRRLRMNDDGMIWLSSENTKYEQITITEFCDFEIWGRVQHSIKTF